MHSNMKGSSRTRQFQRSHFLVLVTILFVLMQFLGSASGQISTPCTSSVISTFTPCMNYVTGSTSNGTSPTTECCNSLKEIMTTNIDCACLIITGSVPLPSILNQAFAISLPRFCNSPGVPIECKASIAPLPSAGPALFAPSPPPSDITPEGEAPTPLGMAASPHVAPGAARRPRLKPAASPVDVGAPSKSSLVQIRNVLNPSGSSPSCTISYAALMLVSLWAIVLKLY